MFSPPLITIIYLLPNINQVATKLLETGSHLIILKHFHRKGMINLIKFVMQDLCFRPVCISDTSILKEEANVSLLSNLN